MTASVRPAPSPARLLKNRVGQTKEIHVKAAGFSSLAGKNSLVVFKRGESDRHFRNDSSHDSSETLVKRREPFSIYDSDASSDKVLAASSLLRSELVHLPLILVQLALLAFAFEPSLLILKKEIVPLLYQEDDNSRPRHNLLLE